MNTAKIILIYPQILGIVNFMESRASLRFNLRLFANTWIVHIASTRLIFFQHLKIKSCFKDPSHNAVRAHVTDCFRVLSWILFREALKGDKSKNQAFKQYKLKLKYMIIL